MRQLRLQLQLLQKHLLLLLFFFFFFFFLITIDNDALFGRFLVTRGRHRRLLRCRLSRGQRDASSDMSAVHSVDPDIRRCVCLPASLSDCMHVCWRFFCVHVSEKRSCRGRCSDDTAEDSRRRQERSEDAALLQLRAPQVPRLRVVGAAFNGRSCSACAQPIVREHLSEARRLVIVAV